MAPRLRFSPVDVGGRDPWWVVLYAVTFAVQGLCGFLRGVVFILPVGIVFAIAGILPLDKQVGNNAASDVCLVIAFGPLLYSLLSLIRPVGAGSYWRTRVGGRAPSDRERLIYDEVLALLRERDPPSLSTSGETLTIEESMTLRARTETAGDVGDEYEWSWGC